MNHKFLRVCAFAIGLSTLTPAVISVGSLDLQLEQWHHAEILEVAVWLVAALVLNLVFFAAYRAFATKLDFICVTHRMFLDGLSGGERITALLVVTALGLFLELGMIRWLAGVYPFFSFYKNYTMLACFLGLGCGYATSDQEHSALPLVLPLSLWLVLLVLFTKHGLPPDLSVAVRSLIPFSDQLHLGLGTVQWHLSFFIASHFFLGVVFLLVSVVFVPIGQACGRLMEGMPKLTAYGLNLLGSLLGMGLMFAFSFLWLPPIVWFAVSFLVLIYYLQWNRPVIAISVGSAALALSLLAFPWDPYVHQIYSPYQLIERTSSKTGLMKILAGGTSFQEVFDYSFSNPFGRAQKTQHGQVDYYEFPYEICRTPTDVLVMGAGSGNDVAAALRMGASHVDAVEIDPAIVSLGTAYHPEHPYTDNRVTVYVTDARTFIRQTNKKYDLVIYGLLDSHTVLSQASSVRVDSFVYTSEGFREARKLLKGNGIMCITFAVCVEEVAKKFLLMMKDAFDGRPPICIRTNMIAGNFMYLQEKDKRPDIPAELISKKGWDEVTDVLDGPMIKGEPSTDDWPFLYMPRRVYPFAYFPMMALVVAITIGVTGGLLGTHFQVDPSKFVFFLLGTGFMLVETKAITELGLAFGNTWQVIGVAISGILFMAFVANYLVARLKISRVTIPYILLAISLVVGYVVAVRGGGASTTEGRMMTLALLTCPVMFSGIIFSTLLAKGGNLSGIMAANLLGAMCGGLLEYNSMYFGFASLYVLALLLYFMAFIAGLLFFKKPALDRARQ
jgi:spermidine synthase